VFLGHNEPSVTGARLTLGVEDEAGVGQLASDDRLLAEL
jgi:hypothetical protein